MSGMRPHHIARLSSAGEVAVSPGGHHVAFTVTSIDQRANRYRSRVWVAATAGGSPWPVSPGSGSDRHPVWSPDGRRLAWWTTDSRSRQDVGRRVVWTAAVGTGGAPGECGSFDDDVEEIAWSPDGRHLAVVARDRDPAQYGSAESPLPVDLMPPRRVTRLMSRLDGEDFVFDRPAHVFLLDAAVAGGPELLTPGPWEARNVSWSPDSTTLVFASARHDSRDRDLCRDLWTLRIHEQMGTDGEVRTDGGPVRLTATDGDHFEPSWAPDGDRVAFLVNPTPMSEARHGQVGVLVASVGAASSRVLTRALDRNAAPYGALRPPAWLGEHLVFAAEDAGSLGLWSVAADGGAPPAKWLGGARQITSWDIGGSGPDDRVVAFVAADSVHLPELHVAPLSPAPLSPARPAPAQPASAHPSPASPGPAEPGAERPVTDLTARLAAAVVLVRPERFVAVSRDGSSVECWAMAPIGAGTGRHPTIVNVHGGPFTQYGDVLFDEFQLQVGAGYGVVYCNPRGSSGYGEAWGRALRWPEADVDPGSGWGGVDAEDVLACVEEACSRYEWIDPERLGIQGGSYGGYLTSWIIGHDQRFKAAVSERAVNNLLTMESDSDVAGFFASYVGHDHLDRPDLYLRQSPITYVRDMTTPLLIVHSEDDLRCPISQAEELFVALRLLGREPELVRFPGETHELSRTGSPAHRRMRAELILEWFDRHLR